MQVINVTRARTALAIALVLGLAAVAKGQAPDTSPAAESTRKAIRPLAIPGDPEATLRQALELERKHEWAPAVRLYEDALELWPDRTDFAHRLRLCETHLKICRRYQDQSFREVLLRLPRDRALGVYDELIERIQHHYVDPVSLEPMVRRGYDNVEVALRDTVFLQLNAANATPEAVQRLRKQLRERRERLVAGDLAAARAEIVGACETAKAEIGLNPAAIVLEFVYGACDVLDTYTMYLTPDKLDDMFAMIDGNFVGLGVELKGDPKGLKIVGVIRGGPASGAGLKVNDRITVIDGKALRGLSLDDAANRLQGEEGSTVEVTIESRDGKVATKRIMRRHVEVESVTMAKLVDPTNGVGYIQLSAFQKSSTDELDKAIRLLEREGMRFLVLDLRGNPGGLLNVAVEIADRFVDRGIIVSTRGRAPGQTQVYRARPDMPYTMPLAVLIDHDSASASEILAGALKDLHRATIMGDRSYGKGSVQSIYELRSIRAGLKLTTAQFYSPTSRPYSEQGVAPDVLVRGAARPKGDGETEEADADVFTFGDPANDPVLALAVERAKRTTSTAAQ
ncbi:MAG: S41 family peptidase [Isosphaeraceae bacterium]|nr:S41 family peptidase [Isosphaeraceae bacterium]